MTTTKGEKTIHARARCWSCGAHWSGTAALERAEQHAVAGRHRVTGLQQVALDVDRRERL